MRDKFSCFSENSVGFLHPSSYSSNPSSVSSSSSSPSPSPSLLPSIQNAVTSVYRTRPPSAHKPLFVTLSWLRSLVLGQSSLTVGFGHDPTPVSPSASSTFKLVSPSSRLFKKSKGSRRIELDKCHVDVFWDFSAARFDRGPEPLGGYYVVVAVDSELGLFLGDMAKGALEKKFKYCYDRTSAPDFCLISRREHCSGNALYHSRCHFGQAGSEHDVVVRIAGGEAGGPTREREPILSVYIDKKQVMRVKRLQWNFRGSQTIFVDGTDLMIDMLWDVHDWFFGQAGDGRGVFMFTTRSGLLDGRFWADDDNNHENRPGERSETSRYKAADDFSLFIYATKNS